MPLWSVRCCSDVEVFVLLLNVCFACCPGNPCFQHAVSSAGCWCDAAHRRRSPFLSLRRHGLNSCFTDSNHVVLVSQRTLKKKMTKQHHGIGRTGSQTAVLRMIVQLLLLFVLRTSPGWYARTQEHSPQVCQDKHKTCLHGASACQPYCTAFRQTTLRVST